MLVRKITPSAKKDQNRALLGVIRRGLDYISVVTENLGSRLTEPNREFSVRFGKFLEPLFSVRFGKFFGTPILGSVR